MLKVGQGVYGYRRRCRGRGRNGGRRDGCVSVRENRSRACKEFLYKTLVVLFFVVIGGTTWGFRWW
jgi:hypothetical protein